MTFGERLKGLREQKGLSQEELSHIVGISQTVISSYECDKSKPKFENIIPLSDALGVSLDILFDKDTSFNDKQIKQFLYSQRDILSSSSDMNIRLTALPFDFVIKEIEREEKRIKKG